jgi:siroheme synthase
MRKILLTCKQMMKNYELWRWQICSNLRGGKQWYAENRQTEESRQQDRLKKADNKTGWRKQTTRQAEESRQQDRLKKGDNKTSCRKQTTRQAEESRQQDRQQKDRTGYSQAE